MKRILWILYLGLFLFLSVLLPQLQSQDFQYNFTALHNEYKLIGWYIRHPDDSLEYFNLHVIYYKLPLKLVWKPGASMKVPVWSRRPS